MKKKINKKSKRSATKVSRSRTDKFYIVCPECSTKKVEHVHIRKTGPCVRMGCGCNYFANLEYSKTKTKSKKSK